MKAPRLGCRLRAGGGGVEFGSWKAKERLIFMAWVMGGIIE